MFADQGGMGFQGQAGRASAIETGTKLYISNLEYGVSNEDIKVFNCARVSELQSTRLPVTGFEITCLVVSIALFDSIISH